MDCTHSRAEKLAIAGISGAVQRLAVQRINGEGDEQAATAELQSIVAGFDEKTRPHLLAHGTTAPNHWLRRPVHALLLAAGADPGDLEAVMQVIGQRADRAGFPYGDQPQV